MATDADPRPACPGWAKVPAHVRAPGSPDRCGGRHAVIVARRGTRAHTAWRLHCLDCQRWWWTRRPGAAAYPLAMVAQTLGWEVAALAGLAGYQARRAADAKVARPYYDPAEPRTGGA